MDDFSPESLAESKNEWCARLVSVVTPAVIEGLQGIFQEALELCTTNGQDDKYLMTFQNFLGRVPKWNQSIIDAEKDRVEKRGACPYLSDLITCVHIVHLKALTCARATPDQKRIEIDIPSASDFIHKVYIAVARQVYTNVYLFDKDIPALDIQRNKRELEYQIRECILDTVRATMPVGDILKAYIAETDTDASQLGAARGSASRIQEPAVMADESQCDQGAASLGQSTASLEPDAPGPPALTVRTPTLGQSTASLGQSTASLGQSTASLGTASLGQGTASLGQSTASLGTASLGQSTASLGQSNPARPVPSLGLPIAGLGASAPRPRTPPVTLGPLPATPAISSPTVRFSATDVVQAKEDGSVTNVPVETRGDGTPRPGRYGTIDDDDDDNGGTLKIHGSAPLSVSPVPIQSLPRMPAVTVLPSMVCA